MVSEPPRPSVVISPLDGSKPWKPATIAISPASIAVWTLSGVTSEIRAFP